jgi:cholesterol transport system auxiliary component
MRMFRLRPAPGLVGLALLLLLGGCTTVGAVVDVVTREPPRLYNLTPTTAFDALPTVNARLSVEVPTATAGLNRSRIAVRPTPTMLDYYAGAQWIDSVPVMVQNVLIQSFENSGAIDVLGREAVGLRADYALLTDLRDFQAEYTDGRSGPPDIRIRVNARLVTLPRRTQVAATTVESVVRAESTGAESIVLAFDAAFDRVAGDLVEWTLRELATRQAGAS